MNRHLTVSLASDAVFVNEFGVAFFAVRLLTRLNNHKLYAIFVHVWYVRSVRYHFYWILIEIQLVTFVWRTHTRTHTYAHIIQIHRGNSSHLLPYLPPIPHSAFLPTSPALHSAVILTEGAGTNQFISCVCLSVRVCVWRRHNNAANNDQNENRFPYVYFEGTHGTAHRHFSTWLITFSELMSTNRFMYLNKWLKPVQWYCHFRFDAIHLWWLLLGIIIFALLPACRCDLITESARRTYCVCVCDLKNSYYYYVCRRRWWSVSRYVCLVYV